MTDNRYYREAAQNQSREGDWEVDEDAVVSMGDDPGAYVMAWVWITREESGIPGPCLTCGTQCDDEGICPACAALEAAQEQLRQATPGVIPSAWRPEERKAIARAKAAIKCALAEGIDSCRNCGKPLNLGDMVSGKACLDEGEGPEEGNVFVYCSTRCRDKH